MPRTLPARSVGTPKRPKRVLATSHFVRRTASYTSRLGIRIITLHAALVGGLALFMILFLRKPPGPDFAFIGRTVGSDIVMLKSAAAEVEALKTVLIGIRYGRGDSLLGHLTDHLVEELDRLLTTHGTTER